MLIYCVLTAVIDDSLHSLVYCAAAAAAARVVGLRQDLCHHLLQLCHVFVVVRRRHSVAFVAVVAAVVASHDCRSAAAILLRVRRKSRRS